MRDPILTQSFQDTLHSHLGPLRQTLKRTEGVSMERNLATCP